MSGSGFSKGAPVHLSYPLTGRLLVRNSPADRVPSHGTDLAATSHSIDLVPVDEQGRSSRYTAASFLRPEPPQLFIGFGRPVLAPITGRVRIVHDGEIDHPAYRGLPSVGYALAQPRRVRRGWAHVAGNHVVIQADPTSGTDGRDDVFVALCHLQHASTTVRVDQQITAGEMIGRCGNTGNSTEPHLHLQAMTAKDATRAEPLPITFADGLPRGGQIIQVRE